MRVIEMSWSIELKSDKPVTESDLDRVMRKILSRRSDLRSASEQAWGWSHNVDVILDVNGQVHLSGASYSGNIGEEFAQKVAKLLNSEGYKIEVGEMVW